MRVELSLLIPGRPVKHLYAEVSLDPSQVGAPDLLAGRLLGFNKEDWIELPVSERAADNSENTGLHVTVMYRGRRYKFTRLESDGTIELAKDW